MEKFWIIKLQKTGRFDVRGVRNQQVKVFYALALPMQGKDC